MNFSPDCVASLKLIAVTRFDRSGSHSEKDKTLTGNKKLSQFSPMSSLLLPHCSPMKISAVVMSCCQWRPDLLDDVCLIIWPNAIGIQILPPTPAGRLRIIEMLSNVCPGAPRSPSQIFSNIIIRCRGLTQHHSSLYIAQLSALPSPSPILETRQIVKSHKSCSQS